MQYCARIVAMRLNYSYISSNFTTTGTLSYDLASVSLAKAIDDINNELNNTYPNLVKLPNNFIFISLNEVAQYLSQDGEKLVSDGDNIKLIYAISGG